jgi:hypothetical protein
MRGRPKADRPIRLRRQSPPPCALFQPNRLDPIELCHYSILGALLDQRECLWRVEDVDYVCCAEPVHVAHDRIDLVRQLLSASETRSDVN